jgi:hypothetical protein
MVSNGKIFPCFSVRIYQKRMMYNTICVTLY